MEPFYDGYVYIFLVLYIVTHVDWGLRYPVGNGPSKRGWEKLKEKNLFCYGKLHNMHKESTEVIDWISPQVRRRVNIISIPREPRHQATSSLDVTPMLDRISRVVSMVRDT